MITNKADYVLGMCNHIILYGTWDKKELDILSQSKNEGSWLWLKGYDRWDVGRPF